MGPSCFGGRFVVALVALAVPVVAAGTAAARGGGGREPAGPAAPGEDAAADRYYRGWYAEHALRDFTAAEADYAAVAAAAESAGASGAALRVRALAGRARCLRALGRDAEARAAAESALAVAPADPEALAARDAAQGTEGNDPDLAAHVGALVEALAMDEETRGRAAADLELVGEPAVPFLAAALRRREAVLVVGASRVLAGMAAADTGSVAAGAALAEALRDPRVLFPRHVSQAVQDAHVVHAGVTLAMLESPDAAIARRAFSGWQWWWRDVDDARLIPLLARGLAHAEEEVRLDAVVAVKYALPSAVEALAPAWDALLRDGSEAVLGRALSACAENPPLAGASRGRLAGFVTHRDAAVRGTALSLLLSLDLLSPEDREGTLVDALRSGDLARVRAAVEDGLLAGRAAWSPALVRALGEGFSRLEGSPDERLSLLGRVAEDPRCGALGAEATARLFDVASRWAEEVPTAVVGPAVEGEALPLPAGAVRGSFGEWFLSRFPFPSRGAAAAAEVFERLSERAGRREWLVFCRARDVPLPPTTGLAAAAADDAATRWLGYRILQGWSRDDIAAGGGAGVAALPHLVPDLASPETPVPQDVRNGEDLGALALDVAGILADPAAAEPLRRLLAAASTPPGRRDAALTALVACIGRGALPEVRAALGGDRWDTARRLLLTILGDDAADDLAALALRLRDAERPLGPHSLPGLPLSGAALERYLLRTGIVEGDGGPPRGEALLPTPNLVMNVLDALPRGEVAARLVRMCALEDRPRLHDAAVTFAVRHLGAEEARPVLLALLDSPVSTARTNAAEELAALGRAATLRREISRPLAEADRAAESRAAAERAAADPDPVKRRGAAHALAALGDAGAVPVLLGLLDDGDPGVRDAALRALERLGAARKE